MIISSTFGKLLVLEFFISTLSTISCDIAPRGDKWFGGVGEND